MNTATNQASSTTDRLMRQVIIPLVLMMGLYGLVRYAITGHSHLPADARPAPTEVLGEAL